MNAYLASVIENVKAKHANEPEFVQTVEEDFSSLTKDQLAHYEKLFHQPEAFIRLGGHLMAIPIPDKEVRKAEKVRKQEAAKKDPNRDAR